MGAAECNLRQPESRVAIPCQVARGGRRAGGGEVWTRLARAAAVSQRPSGRGASLRQTSACNCGPFAWRHFCRARRARHVPAPRALCEEARASELRRRTRYCRPVPSDALVDEIGRRLGDAAPARSRVILFGSRARGESHTHSDVDVLVIEPSVDDPIQESVRLRRTLRGLGVPIDVLVFGREDRGPGDRGGSGRFAKGGSWLTSEELEEARRLLKAARSALRAAEALAADALDVLAEHGSPVPEAVA
jgi:predicted nucleotidyltransferase